MPVQRKIFVFFFLKDYENLYQTHDLCSSSTHTKKQQNKKLTSSRAAFHQKDQQFLHYLPKRNYSHLLKVVVADVEMVYHLLNLNPVNWLDYWLMMAYNLDSF